MTSLTSSAIRRVDVLVIEDNPAFVQVLRYWLPGRVFAVPTLHEGFQHIRDKRWTRIILDLNLPDSAQDTTESIIPAIKMVAPWARLIVITGLPVNAQKLLASGAAAVIEKGDPKCGERLLSLL